MWTLSDNKAKLSIDSLNLEIDLLHVNRGLASVSIAGHSWADAALLSIWLPSRVGSEPLAPEEAYVRGSDLIATYPPLPPNTIQPQVYWRARQDASLGAVGVELILSAQTSQLYSEPQTPVTTTIPGVEGALVWAPGDKPGALVPTSLPRTLSAARGENGLIACGIPGTNYVYVEMVHPSDLEAMHVVATNGGVRLSAQVFQEHLEKGVIRRARICGWFVPASGWQRRAWSLFDSYCQQRPPLTA